MRTLRLSPGILLAMVLAAGALGTAATVRAQSHDELKALHSRISTLNSDGKYAEAIPLAERYAEAMRERYGPQHPEYATGLNNLALLLQNVSRFAEAEPLMRRVLVITEQSFGPNSPGVAIALNNLATLLRQTNRHGEAEPLMRRALAINEASLGRDHPNVITSLNNLAELLRHTDRPAEAEPLYRRALAIAEKTFGPEHPNVGGTLNNLAELLGQTNRLAEAEPLYRRALAIDEQSLGREHPSIAIDLNNLALLLRDTDRLAEAEPLLRRSLVIFEKALGPEHPNVALALNNLAQLLQNSSRLAEAEPLLRRAIAVDERSLGAEHPRVASSLHNLATLLRDAGQLAEAGPLVRRALAIDEKSFGPEHPRVARDLINLALLLDDAEAEPLMRRALAIQEKSMGPDHREVAINLNNLAFVLKDTGRAAEAEPLFHRALAINEKSLGPDHSSVAVALHNLAQLRAVHGDWSEAAQLWRRAKVIIVASRGRQEAGGRADLAKAMLASSSWELRAAARAAHRSGPGSADARGEGFELAQWALHTGAADALAQMSARFAKGAGPLALLMRERQDLLARRQGEDKHLLAAVGKADARAAEVIRIALAEFDRKLNTIDERLAAEFPDYTSLTAPKPLTIAAVQDLLKGDEVLAAFLDIPRMGSLPEETLAWAVTKTQARWISVPLGTAALAERVARLRCGLDREGLWSWSREKGRWLARGTQCRGLRPEGLGATEPLPFDLGAAHELYAALLQPFADLMEAKSLIVVPSGPLTSLPFHVLVSEVPPAPDLQSQRPYRAAAWLALKLPITVLPSVGSLLALRRLPPSEAKEPYLAFGNPLLDGVSDDESSRLARAKQRCPPDLEGPHQRVPVAARNVPGLGTLIRGGGIDLAALRAQAPLPETADELCAVAKALGVLERQAQTVWLGARATEGNLKALSREGKLARYSVLHFATHGLLAGETESILKAKAEPALILNPPRQGATTAELDEDDGLLTASEVAQLDLDADWVVLSACNTAAGEKGDAEALSGLARAFFYAKARALLVSHWYVISDAAVKLTTAAFATLRTDPSIGRAEALRRSMAGLITGPRPEEALPEYWAPFVLVGEGGK